MDIIKQYLIFWTSNNSIILIYIKYTILLIYYIIIYIKLVYNIL